MFNKNLKTKRGFSLVELMVVVAIMGTLAAIAIPAYNEYRKTAKKGAYKADLTSLHKGWLAFGVELDNFCQRESSPEAASISSVGMESLINSKLYGSTTQANATCTVSATPTGGAVDATQWTTCDNTVPGDCTSSHCQNSSTTGGVTFKAYDAGNGPGKANFIGFGGVTAGCGTALTDIQVKDSTVADAHCDLTSGTYDMGVYGHVSGDIWHSAEIKHTGVFTDQGDGSDSVALAATCTS